MKWRRFLPFFTLLLLQFKYYLLENFFNDWEVAFWTFDSKVNNWILSYTYRNGFFDLIKRRKKEHLPSQRLSNLNLSISGAVVDIRDNPDRPFGMIGLEWIIRIETPDSRTPFEVAAASQSEALVRVHHRFSRILNFLLLLFFQEKKSSFR